MRNISLVWLAPGEVISTINQVQGRTRVGIGQKKLLFLVPRCAVEKPLGCAGCLGRVSQDRGQWLNEANPWKRSYVTAGPSPMESVVAKWLMWATWQYLCLHVPVGDPRSPTILLRNVFLWRCLSWFAVDAGCQLPAVWPAGSAAGTERRVRIRSLQCLW